MTYLTKAAFTAVLLSAAIPAHASALKCTPAEDLVVAMTTLSGFAPELTDRLKLDMVLHVTREDGSPLGERVFYRAPDGAETAMTIDAQNVMSGADVLAGADARGELCRSAKEGAAIADSSSFSASMKFAYNDAGGTHSADALMEGAADGRKQLKALAPVAVRLMVPKLRYVVASKTDKAGPDLTVTAMRGDAPVDAFQVHYIEGMPTVSLAALKKAGADRIVITGGPYDLLAMPKPDKGELSDTPQAGPAE